MHPKNRRASHTNSNHKNVYRQSGQQGSLLLAEHARTEASDGTFIKLAMMGLSAKGTSDYWHDI